VRRGVLGGVEELNDEEYCMSRLDGRHLEREDE
jgi:hypothetical protein